MERCNPTRLAPPRPSHLLLAFTLLFCSLPGVAAPPVETFARLPQVSNPRLSPDGEFLAMEMSYQGSRVLVTRDLYGKEPPAMVQPGDLLLHDYYWVSDDRLILTVRATARFRGFVFNYLRLVSMDKLGREMSMPDMDTDDLGFYKVDPYVIHELPEDPEHILASINNDAYSGSYPLVHKVNLKTGKAREVDDNDMGFIAWFPDSEGRLRVGVNFDNQSVGEKGRKMFVHHRGVGSEDWQIISEGYPGHDEMFFPVGFEPEDPNTLLVTLDFEQFLAAGFERVDLHSYDLVEGKLRGTWEDPLVEAIEAATRKAVGVEDATVTSEDHDRTRFIVKTISDVQPPAYYLYEREAKSLAYLGGEYPDLEDAALAPMQAVSFTARDGREIPAYLTLPVGSDGKNLPLVVYPHGGPWARDYWGFEPYVQLLASRGYAVLQPQFRGSTGFGNEHYEAGVGQWGSAIQDDITDGTRWLIEGGVADPDRICIYGASFGGYAAVMGAIKAPDLYRCAISENGVMDLPELAKSARYADFRSRNAVLVDEAFEADDVSPLHRYREIKIPLLLLAGENDTVVPYRDHSRRLYGKLKRRDVATEMVLIEDGEHWRTNEAHELLKMQKIVAFLEAHIGNGPAPGD